MSKQVDLELLFNRDFDQFQKDTSSQFDNAMEKKIKRMQWLKYFKWVLGILIISGTLFTSILLMNKDGNADQTHHHATELVEPNKLVEASEIKIMEEEEISESMPIYNTSSGVLEGSLVNESPQKKSENVNIVKVKTLIEDENIVKHAEFVFEEKFPSKKEINTIDYEQTRFPIPKRNTLALPSILIEKEKRKPQRKKKKSLKQKKEDIIPALTVSTETKKTKENKRKQKQKKEEAIPVVTSAEIEISQSKTKLKKQNISNEKTQNEASEALVMKPKKVKRVRKASDFSGSIEFGFSPIFFKNMSAPYEPNRDSVTFFITNKKPKISYDFGVEFLFKQVDSDWSFKTGLHYQKLNEEIDYYFQKDRLDEELSHWQYDSIFEYHIDPPIHDTVLVGIDSSYYEHWVSNVNQKKHVNQYTYLNIPLLMGYQISFPNDRFKVNVLAGANMSILLQNEGYYYDSDGYILPYETKQKAVINWALSAQMSVYYQWKKMAVYAKPSLQFQMKEKALDDYFERRQYVIYGLEFGINFKLF